MELMKGLLQAEVKECNCEDIDIIPYLVLDRYELKRAKTHGVNFVMAFVKGELDTLPYVKGHIETLRSVFKMPVVLVLPKTGYRQMQYMISKGISFIVPDKQAYLPFLGVVLRKESEKPDLPELLLPSAQMIVLYIIYLKARNVSMQQLVKDCGYTGMSVTRAVSQLEKRSLIYTEKEKVQKIIIPKYMGREMFEKAKPFMQSPLRVRLYTDKTNYRKDMISAGISALSHYSMINEPDIACYAVRKIDFAEKETTDQLMDDQKQIEIEQWRYDPGILAKNGCVDPLSLSLSLADSEDERVVKCTEKMLEKYWEAYDGKGNGQF